MSPKKSSSVHQKYPRFGIRRHFVRNSVPQMEEGEEIVAAAAVGTVVLAVEAASPLQINLIPVAPPDIKIY